MLAASLYAVDVAILNIVGVAASRSVLRWVTYPLTRDMLDLQTLLGVLSKFIKSVENGGLRRIRLAVRVGESDRIDLFLVAAHNLNLREPWQK